MRKNTSENLYAMWTLLSTSKTKQRKTNMVLNMACACLQNAAKTEVPVT